MSSTNPIFSLKLPSNLVGNGSNVTSFLRLKWKNSKSKPYKPFGATISQKSNDATY